MHTVSLSLVRVCGCLFSISLFLTSPQPSPHGYEAGPLSAPLQPSCWHFDEEFSPFSCEHDCSLQMPCFKFSPFSCEHDYSLQMPCFKQGLQHPAFSRHFFGNLSLLYSSVLLGFLTSKSYLYMETICSPHRPPSRRYF